MNETLYNEVKLVLDPHPLGIAEEVLSKLQSGNFTGEIYLDDLHECGCFYGTIYIALHANDPDFDWNDQDSVRETRPENLIEYDPDDECHWTPAERYLYWTLNDEEPFELIEALAAYVEQRKESSSE